MFDAPGNEVTRKVWWNPGIPEDDRRHDSRHPGGSGAWRVQVVTRGHGEHRLLGRFCQSRDGRAISSTAEVSYATGSLCDLRREANSEILYDFADQPSSEEGDYDTVGTEDGRMLFNAIDGTTVHESDVVLASASRESEFLAQNVGADVNMTSSPK
ncbi:hypothetical protein [Paraburkholderia dipogonis]|uniref:hypothetical protein n=1 Tax=Paraburkholderia dipogonis TaxID=1211383 RepID=UPI0038BDCE4A